MSECNPAVKDETFKNIKGVIFDCDGVLFDSRDVNIRFYNQIRHHFYLPDMTPEQEEFVHMHSVQDSLEHILPQGFEKELPRLREKLDYTQLLDYMRMEEGLVDLLELLLENRFKIAINTNRTNTMGLLLSRFDLERFFNPVVTAADVQRPKPHPESLFKILDHWSLEPGDVVFIGDSVVDQSTAQGAEVPFWAYKNQELEGRMLIPDFRVLREYFNCNLKS
ncbi:MAG: HAD family hydrolase [Desulfonatronovibrionaceae bacterium]